MDKLITFEMAWMAGRNSRRHGWDTNPWAMLTGCEAAAAAWDKGYNE